MVHSSSLHAITNQRSASSVDGSLRSDADNDEKIAYATYEVLPNMRKYSHPTRASRVRRPPPYRSEHRARRANGRARPRRAASARDAA
eukprot:4596561-Pleurochrysis_carterae.AAC.1